MADEYRSGQGTIIPTMFLGMGGTGSRIVDRIAARAAKLPNWESQLRPLTHFVSVDTNELDQHKLAHVPAGNRLNIAAFDKARVIEGFRRSKDEQALQWLDKGYQPRPGFKPGAGQIRVESRLGFFYHSPEIRERLKQLVQESLRPGITWRQAVPPKYNVYLVCTLAGGTGSGSFLPMAYLIQSVIAELNWQPRVIGNLLLSTLMLDKNAPELHPDIHANTYAALKELEHLTKLDYKQVKDEGRTYEPFVYCRDGNSPGISHVTTRPFFLAFLFDRPAHVALRDVEAAVADAAYLQVFTPIIDNLAGELDNYEKNLEGLTRFPGELKAVGQGYTKNFGAFGAVGMVLPGSDLLEYAARRFAAQAIRSQITFGVEPSGGSDDRTVALARLAVDYSDPKFLHMGDEGRERAINQAFVESVREMARQDARQELTEGFWYQLVESIDEGRLTGTTEKGEVQRSESVLDRIARKMDEDRRELMNKVAIKERAFVFHKEGLNQYIEYVSRLLEEIREARRIVDQGVRGLETAAAEGEMLVDQKLDPIAERYLALRLVERLEQKWVPEAAAQLEAAKVKDVMSNPKVRERLESELYKSLQEAAGEKKLFGRGDQAFLAAREEAQEYYRGVAAAARKLFDAEIRLRQLRALGEYLRRRARQYARLAAQMDALVQDLERDAERLRSGQADAVPGLELRIEVFETLDEPRRRIWDRVYGALYLDGGRYLATFDRETLAHTISQELKPVVRPDGTVVEKTVNQIVSDLRRALLDLGRTRLRGAIFGEDGEGGLDLGRGLELEARLVLEQGRRAEDDVTEEEIDGYVLKKVRALSQLAGVLARVRSAEARALDDGVKVNRTRQLILGGLGSGDGGVSGNSARTSEKLRRVMESVLASSGRQVRTDLWHDPRIAIVHDVELPVPLYYLQPVNAEIEDSYLAVQGDERRSYNLHIDFNWESSLPNLNPRRSEIAVGWSLRVLAQGLLTRLVYQQGQDWFWRLDEGRPPEPLGQSLSSALYRIGEIYSQTEILRKSFEKRIGQIGEEMGPEARTERRTGLYAAIESALTDMELRQRRGEMSREDILDRPILRVLLQELEKDLPIGASADASTGRSYRLEL
ncbi:MAG TPA: tubulin-like doman-containing protein [Thermoanaerobaculia bacterium]|nr:tubulin-like doman-containing protein [Thermoanaerobaculia bacterium]